MSDISNVGLIGLYNSFYALELRVADLGGGSGLFTSDISNVSLVGLYNSFNTLEARVTALDGGEGDLYSFTSAFFTVSRSLSNSASSDAHRTGPTLAEARSWLSGTSNGGGGHSWANTYVESGGFQGYQKWTIPKSGKYQIIAKGGGSGFTDTPDDYMLGVKVTAEFTLVKNNKLIIVVGQGVPDFDGDHCNGAGGASWVMSGSDNSTAIPLVVANGAGGDTSDGGVKVQPNVTLGSSFSITHAGVTTTGKQTTPINLHSGTGNGYGGTNPSAPNSGGWLSSGTSRSTGGNASAHAAGYLTGLQGGTRSNGTAGYGGFGGGSGGFDEFGSAGGGFTGAHGSDNSVYTGHGSSYVNDTRESTPTVELASSTTTYQNSDYTSENQYQGWVKITFVE